jgi:hypothetical protein
MSDEDYAAGLARLEADAALETNPQPVFQDAHLIVFEKPQQPSTAAPFS